MGGWVGVVVCVGVRGYVCVGGCVRGCAYGCACVCVCAVCGVCVWVGCVVQYTLEVSSGSNGNIKCRVNFFLGEFTPKFFPGRLTRLRKPDTSVSLFQVCF